MSSKELKINDKGQIEFSTEEFGGPVEPKSQGIAQDVAVNWPDKADQVREMFFNWMDARAEMAKKNIDETLAIRKQEYDEHVAKYSAMRKKEEEDRAARRVENQKLADERKEKQAEEMLDAMERAKAKRTNK